MWKVTSRLRNGEVKTIMKRHEVGEREGEVYGDDTILRASSVFVLSN
jgi:hypothetical protein